MTEPNIKDHKHHKRAVFPKGKQRDFLKNTQARLNLTLKEFTKLAGVCIRSMTDWKREKFSMSLPALKRLCRKVGIPLPKNIKIKNPFWYVYKGGRIGGLAVYKKYGKIGGDSNYRKKKWREWWERVGKFNPNKYFVVKEIDRPRKNAELSEFIGVILGDGGITSKQVSVTLHKFDDRYFIDHVNNLFQKLFKLNPSVYERKGENIVNIVVSRSELVQFLESVGLKTGGKVRQQVDVPSWIKKSEKFAKSCLRGLFDTDGCFYIDKHRYKDKVYYNCAMCFRNYSIPILFFFKTKLEQLGFHPTRNAKFSISLRREEEIIGYFQKVGTSNPKHLNKFKRYFKNKFGEVPKWS